ncbi:Hsp20/alpha crystallin family protein [Brevibacillus humidisoli]|uniref:Hsp20/alpha crystallin family protein n=1 Tax=Brevibacillus humidisoli TaxID=2895522 RepID=UPI001E5597F1|nr:Hsp20/alpha crystallin family protein [Brevibacillus humidisoli]UFJ41546.1 Hsp20/alpha crystallin family protein [Brevibacillus humidisoli]
MYKKEFPKFNWKTLQDQAGDLLGKDFWQDVIGMVPNLGPRLDGYETDQGFVVVVELPGLDSPEAVKLRIKGDVLVISGEINRTYSVREDRFFQTERFTGPFTREVPLPSPVQPQSINAQYYNGLLEVYIARENQTETEIPIDYVDDKRFSL